MLGAVTSIATATGVSISLKPTSQSRASKVIGGVIQSALAGNLTALKCLDERQRIGIAAERAVWQAGYQQVVTTKPELLGQYNSNKSRIPPIVHTNPESAAASALANPYSASGVQTPTAVISQTDPALSVVSQMIPSTGKGLPLWVLLLLAGGIGFAVYKATRGK